MKQTRTEKAILARIEELGVERERQFKLLEQAYSRKRIECPCCNKSSPISSIELVCQYHYIQPRGCTDGDYYVFSNEYLLVCPKCQGLGRVWKRSLSYVDGVPKPDPMLELFEFIQANSKLFFEVYDNYDYGDIEQIRKKHKQRQEKLENDKYWY